MNAPHYPYHLIVIVVVIIITIIIIIYCHYLFSERCTGIVDARVRIPASLNSFQVFFSRLHKLRRYLRWCSLHLFLDNTVPIYKFSYIHHFIFSFPGYITNKFTDQFLVSLLAQLFRALHQYRRCQGLNPGKSDFFRLSFRDCISCVNTCDDLLYTYIYFFIPQFQYMNFIYSLFHYHYFIINRLPTCFSLWK